MEDSRLDKKEEESSFTGYTDIFKQLCPSYMAMGMSYNEFWYGDIEVACVYKEAFEQKQKLKNENLWLQGLYFYKALQSVASQIFSEKESDAETYLNKPIDFDEEQKEEDNIKQKEYEKLQAELWMNNFVRQYNQEG
ncbi:hypothetical protein [Anaerofustis stercorihominis]|uniref:hypothetical protein n=1 Tax=Anaerofustis stercorihominis TaxID=214853 RepID=UPI00214AA00B|nr:hypothetical protein [Anaerofustis stercorihominis]MCR2033717.1 hypothetical protein [Anaerofustis stercorihominis]